MGCVWLPRVCTRLLPAATHLCLKASKRLVSATSCTHVAHLSHKQTPTGLLDEVLDAVRPFRTPDEPAISAIQVRR